MSTEPDLPGDLINLAREDLASAEALHAAERISDSPVGFHAQQSVEKALKAVIASRDLKYPFTHDLGVLIQLCEDAGLVLPTELAVVDRLNPYAAAIRYGLGNPGTVDAEEAIRWASLAVKWAEGLVAERPVDHGDEEVDREERKK